MHIINTWAELDAYLCGPIPTDLKALLATRRDQLQEYGDLSDLGMFAVIEPGDTIDSISEAVGWPILMEGIPTFEWVQLHGGIFEMPFVLSDSGSGHVLFVPDQQDINPALLELCRDNADQPSSDPEQGAGMG